MRASHMVDRAYLAPHLVIRVGVTGHRPNKLATASLPEIVASVGRVLATIRDAAQAVHADLCASQPSRLVDPDQPRLNLATSIAEGADRILAHAAIEQNYGLNLILPFRRDVYADDFTGEALRDYEALCRHPAVRSLTEIDAPRGASNGEAYRDAGRLVLDHSDVLVAIWDQAPAAGTGGTAEIVEEAIRRGMIVVLIAMDGEPFIWEASPTTLGALERGRWQRLSLDKTSKVLTTRIEQLLRVPTSSGHRPATTTEHGQGKSSPEHSLATFSAHPLKPHTWFFGYAWLRRILTGKGSWNPRVDSGLTRERSEAWKRTAEAAELVGGLDFRDRILHRLRERWIGADNLAVHYAHRFRTAFILNFSLAALAVALGLLVLFNMDSLAAKAAFVTAELLLIGTILLITRRGLKGCWREKWLDYRSLAETLRPARLTALIGGSPLRPGGTGGGTGGDAWVAWYVRAALRELEPPTGRIDTASVTRALRTAIEEEIEPQIVYHRSNARNLALLDHRLELAAEAALFTTIVCGLVFLGLFFLHHAFDLTAPARLYKPLATFLGGTLPVAGAAIFGIRATGDFRTAMRQSQRMEQSLTAIKETFDAAIAEGGPDIEQATQLFSALSRILADDLRLWGMVYSERELAPGF